MRTVLNQKLLPPINPSLTDKNTNLYSKNEVIAETSWYKRFNRVQIIEKNKLENNR